MDELFCENPRDFFLEYDDVDKPCVPLRYLARLLKPVDQWNDRNKETLCLIRSKTSKPLIRNQENPAIKD